MAFTLNKISLLGNIGKDPETKFTTSNLAVTTFSIATVHSYKGKDGNYVDDTTWHNVKCFALSDYFRNNLHKGVKIYLEGRQTNQSYEDASGNKKYYSEVIADNFSIILLGEKSTSTNQQNSKPASLPEDENDNLPF